jgi:hypothetical protein
MEESKTVRRTAGIAERRIGRDSPNALPVLAAQYAVPTNNENRSSRSIGPDRPGGWPATWSCSAGCCGSQFFNFLDDCDAVLA